MNKLGTFLNDTKLGKESVYFCTVLSNTKLLLSSAQCLLKNTAYLLKVRDGEMKDRYVEKLMRKLVNHQNIFF